MTEGITMQEWLKSLSSVSSLDSRFVLIMDSNGNPYKATPVLLQQPVMTTGGYLNTNLDEAVTPGLYALQTEANFTGTLPSVGYWYEGTLEIIKRNTVIIQRLMSPTVSAMALRRKVGEGDWNNWSIFKPS